MGIKQPRKSLGVIMGNDDTAEVLFPRCGGIRQNSGFSGRNSGEFRYPTDFGLTAYAFDHYPGSSCLFE